MPHQTVILTSFEQYLTSTDQTQDELYEEMAARTATLSKFPHAVMLELAYPERDYANRWAWQQFGPRDGECFDVRTGLKPSEYPMCQIAEPHEHSGSWCCRWIVKTDYDFGFCEWYFANPLDKDSFLQFAPSITWGENYPL